MSKICAFFGHRHLPQDSFDLEARLRLVIETAVTQLDVSEFWNGGYGDFDALAAKMVVGLKARYPHIRLRQIYAYPPLSSALRRGFDSAVYPDLLDNLPDKWHIPCRNIWMAEQADLLIAYVDHAGSKIHAPLDHVCGMKLISNLGSYIPVYQSHAIRMPK